MDCDVEVIGRLVQHEDVGILEQGAWPGTREFAVRRLRATVAGRTFPWESRGR